MFEALYHRTAKVLEREVPMNSIVKVNFRKYFLIMGFVLKLRLVIKKFKPKCFKVKKIKNNF